MRIDQCTADCTADCGACKGEGRPTLKPIGVAVLLAFWEDIHPPKNERPGLLCRAAGRGQTFIQAVGYDTPEQAKAELDRAAAVCHDGGLLIAPAVNTAPHEGFVVRRQPVPTA